MSQSINTLPKIQQMKNFLELDKNPSQVRTLIRRSSHCSRLLLRYRVHLLKYKGLRNITPGILIFITTALSVAAPGECLGVGGKASSEQP